jgi:hypothetical protein
MANLQSPGVLAREWDLTTVVPSVSISDGALAGVFRWGPLEKRVLIDSEDQLVKFFGKPSNLNSETWFTGASFLAYSNRLWVTRAANTAGITPSVTATSVAGNNTVTLTTGNTSGLEVGLILISALNGGLKVGTQIASIVNSTAFTVTLNADSLANSTGDSFQFVSNTVFAAVANTGSVANLEYCIIKNEDDFTAREGTFDTDVHFIARYPGELGNSLRVSICGNSSGYQSTINLASYANATFTITPNSNTTTFSITTTSNTAAGANATSLKALLNVTDKVEVGNGTVGYQYLKITGIGNTVVTGNDSTGTAEFSVNFEDVFTLAESFVYNGANTSTRTFDRFWEFHNYVDAAPGQSDYLINFGNSSINSDEMHVVIVDEGGKFTGTPGAVLETYRSVSRGINAKTLDGGSNFWKERINDASQFVWAVNDIATAPSANVEYLTSSTLDVENIRFQLGRDGKDEANIPISCLTRAYDFYKSKEDSDIALIMQGRTRSFTLANYLIDNIAETRQDCVVFISPQKGDVVNNVGFEADACISFRNNLRSTSYGVIDSGYKYMYDRYNDVFRWVPLNGDIAGLCARTDTTNDPWWSPAGFNRGNIKNVVKLAWNPREAFRDELYKNGINPVVNFPGQGVVLYGDKTMLAKPSAFDRINVRRLFIVLKKAISKAARYSLFEFNDVFTRAQFKNMVVPYLRDIQAKRGITDFLVVCDETNNTGERIDKNEFYGDIYIKPARSINYIYLNFVAVRTSVAFTEVVGRFGG